MGCGGCWTGQRTVKGCGREGRRRGSRSQFHGGTGEWVAGWGDWALRCSRERVTGSDPLRAPSVDRGGPGCAWRGPRTRDPVTGRDGAVIAQEGVEAGARAGGGWQTSGVRTRLRVGGSGTGPRSLCDPLLSTEGLRAPTPRPLSPRRSRSGFTPHAPPAPTTVHPACPEVSPHDTRPGRGSQRQPLGSPGPLGRTQAQARRLPDRNRDA